MNEAELIRQFEEQHKDIAIAYGGDGTLLSKAAEVWKKKNIIPVRNYSRCSKHEHLLEEICTGNVTSKELKAGLKWSKAPFLEARLKSSDEDVQPYRGIAEIVLKSYNPTEALCFTVFVNGKAYMQQCIADGVIFASKLGSHGYFKSVTRTLFTDNDSVGLGFIASTYGICNLVLKATDKVIVKLDRYAITVISHDKEYETVELKAGEEIELSQSCEGVSLFGYDVFCCQDCRNLRNSTLVNDKYIA